MIIMGSNQQRTAQHVLCHVCMGGQDHGSVLGIFYMNTCQRSAADTWSVVVVKVWWSEHLLNDGSQGSNRWEPGCEHKRYGQMQSH